MALRHQRDGLHHRLLPLYNRDTFSICRAPVWFRLANPESITISDSADSGEIGAAAATVSTLPEGYDNKDHANNKNAEGNPASGPNSPGQTNACADIHVTPDGKFLYGSNRGHDSLVCFAIGEGTPAAPAPCGLGAASTGSRGQVAR